MKIDKADFFREVTTRICSSLDIGEALTATYDYISRVMPVDAIGLDYLDASRMSIFPVARVERNGFISFLGDDPTEIPVDDELMAFIEEKERGGRMVASFNDPSDLPAAVLRCFPHIANCSTIGLHLRIRDQDVGGLFISKEGRDYYTAEHIELIESVNEPIAMAMSNARHYLELKRMSDMLEEDNRMLSADIGRISGSEVIGADFGLKDVMNMVSRVSVTNSPVLLLGETGTGKEVIANAIHRQSPRGKGPMIRLQCGAVPESLLDSELFGHERGAYTGAASRKRGRFERADGGTLFLDEIGELTLGAQVKLLRVLQEQQFERVGGTETISVDVRVIAATHRDLEKMVREGSFREDLWYRLNVLIVRIPPLRLRRGDIFPLVQYVIERKAREMNRMHTPGISSEDIERLRMYDWPGNVRELQNVLERALILSNGPMLHLPELDAGVSGRTAPAVRDAEKRRLCSMDQVMADHIRFLLEHTNGQVAGAGGAAGILQMNPSTLRFRMKKLGITLSAPRRSVS